MSNRLHSPRWERLRKGCRGGSKGPGSGHVKCALPTWGQVELLRTQLTNEARAQGSNQGWRDDFGLHCTEMTFKARAYLRERG